MGESNKLKIAWYSFSCCEDSTIMFAELLNDYFFEFKEHFDFVDASIFSSKRDTECPLDIAFIEGALIDPHHIELAKKLRQRAKTVVAIGSCACTGMPSAHRNNFTDEQNKEIGHILEKFHYSENVKKLEDELTVDIKVPGCPMDLNFFLQTVNKALEMFGHEPIAVKNQETVATPPAV